MKLKLKNTPEQVELVRAMGSRNPAEAREATEAFAAFIGPVVSKVLQQAGSAGLIYSDSVFDEDDNPSYPLDLYYNESQDMVTIWSQSVAGGLPTSELTGMSEMKISTYRLDSAVSMLKRYARRARLDVVSKAVERMAQEILLKQERNAWAVILKALAEAETNSLLHVIGSTTPNRFIPDDLNRLMTRIKRINSSWADGTPADFSARGLTDLFVSPEMMQEVRGFAYNPINSTIGNADTGPVQLPDASRQQVWNSAGMGELWGVTLHELLELGASSKKYNVLFDHYAGTSIPKGGLNNGAEQTPFDAVDHEILVGLDLSREAFIRPVAQQADSGGTFTALPDDQYVSRAEKLGFYGFLEEGRVCLDARAICGIAV